jgi:alcohol dehydrogenase class IV
MRAWSRSIEAIARSEAERLSSELGVKALEFARREARKARDQRNHRLARQYALVAAYIAGHSAGQAYRCT